MRDFAVWPRDGQLKPTFCVWKLAPVLFEKDAWVDFLRSERNDAALQRWRNAVYTGRA